MIKRLNILLLVIVILFLAFGCGPRTPEAELERIVELLQQQRTLDALIRLENFIDKYPDEEITLQARLLLARLYLQNQNYSESLSLFREIEESPHYREELKFLINPLLLQAYTGSEQYDKALEMVEEEIDLILSDLDSEVEQIRETAALYYGGILLTRSQLYFTMEEDEKAVETLQTVKEVAVNIFDRADASRLLANYYLMHDEPEKAEQEIRLVSEEILPENSAAQWMHLDLARYYENQGEPEKAEPYYEHILEWTEQALEKAVAENDREEIAIYVTALGDLEYQKGNFDEAQAVYEKVEQEYGDTDFVKSGQPRNRIAGLDYQRKMKGE